MKISTKSGDGGESGTFGGKRLKKSGLIFEVLGDLDELNAVLGWCRVGAKKSIGDDKKRGRASEILKKVQEHVYGIMAVVGGEGDVSKLPAGFLGISENDVEFLEEQMKVLGEGLGEMKEFVLPGENDFSSRLHIARTVCRRAERGVVRYGEEVTLPEVLVKYLNRLSDFLFVLGEALHHEDAG